MNVPARFDDRLVLITGAANGIGAATAQAFAAAGARLLLIDRDGPGLGRLARVLARDETEVTTRKVDLADAAALQASLDGDVANLGVPDVLVNVAGIIDTAVGTDISQVDTARWERVLAVNLTAPFLLCRALLPGMAARGSGAIVNVASVAARWKSTNCTVAYTASKAGLLGLTRQLAADYGGSGVRVNAICPGSVDTDAFHEGDPGRAVEADERARREAKSAAYAFLMPIKRVSSPAEQAAAILFLASYEASYVNGVALDVNGGMYMA